MSQSIIAAFRKGATEALRGKEAEQRDEVVVAVKALDLQALGHSGAANALRDIDPEKKPHALMEIKATDLLALCDAAAA
jgi:hypothetical protein